MAAFWHISFPYQISIEEKEETRQLMAENYLDFEFQRLNEYETQSPALPDGSRLTFKRKDAIYSLPNSLLQTEYKAFYHDFLAAFRAQYAKAESLYASSFRDSLVVPFLSEFDALDFTEFDREYEDALRDLEHNYYIEIDGLASMYVYEGYPIGSHFRSSMGTVSILRSYEKMNVMAQETVTFFNFCEWAKTNLADKYRLAKYLFVAGY